MLEYYTVKRPDPPFKENLEEDMYLHCNYDYYYLQASQHNYSLV